MSSDHLLASHLVKDAVASER